MKNNIKKIAITYDWIDKWGGVERIILKLHQIYPNAEFYTSHYNPTSAPWAKNLKIHTSFMQRLPSFILNNRVFSAPFYPYAFESFDFNSYDLVISITSSYAKAIITRPETKHLCYILTPTRFLWVDTKSRQRLGFLNKFLRPYFDYLKKWDYIIARRPDKYIAISKTVQKRLEEFYNLKSEVIYPPFDTEYWDEVKLQVEGGKKQEKEFYLVVSRLEPYKNVDVVIETFNELPDKNLIIIGSGSQESLLKNSANKNIKFLKDISDVELSTYYQNAKALIMMQEEDFGYVALEAQFFNCPVIAYSRGGVKETVIDGKTGILLNNNDRKSLTIAIDKFEKIAYNFKANMRKKDLSNLKLFSINTFKEKFSEAVKNIS